MGLIVFSGTKRRKTWSNEMMGSWWKNIHLPRTRKEKPAKAVITAFVIIVLTPCYQYGSIWVNDVQYTAFDDSYDFRHRFLIFLLLIYHNDNYFINENKWIVWLSKIAHTKFHSQIQTDTLEILILKQNVTKSKGSHL